MSEAETGARLRAAMRRMPGPVAVITTLDPADGTPAGLAASAVIPVSMAPPSMLVAVNRSAGAYVAIGRSQRFCINLLSTRQASLVGVFSDSSRRAERFEGDDWMYRHGLGYRPDACANIFCNVEQTAVFGTHELFIGRVDEVLIGTGEAPMGWIEGGFAQLRSLADAS